MAKIALRHVADFNRDQLHDRSIVNFLNFRGRNSPFRANMGATFLVSHLPMPYPNITKRKSPQVYPLSMPVDGVDGEI